MVKERLATLNLAFESLPPLSSLQGKFFEEVIEQTYARCVKPQLALLKLTPDKTWSSKVYGELMPHLLDEMFERAKIGKDSLFVDLGSGVGNVVAQASLSTGCASFGIEVCKGPSEIASTFTEQVAARGSIWGMKAGTIKVECGDMLNNKLVPLVIASADMVLVNNKVFSAEREWIYF
ncbi:histone methylation protein DOT1-domain-containing protein [Rhodocollybia butyracea]|uniref:Histone-lysine N-methyltransferase, H3 lysine-79 specific n=1 Tax=Rhodocollybia butyracea TaxID=206335 RepID=A0A9P5U4Y3_9AGAR|nr:histone methylation protein DOT1-domain-containing protein [Rhodocollybia butyracea]